MAFLAPAGTPVPFFRAGMAMLRGAVSEAPRQALARRLAESAGHRYCALFITGRASMIVGLEALRSIERDPSRNEVLIPAYTCYSVPAAVLRAGLKPRLCDVSPETLSFDPETLARADTSRTLAIVSANLYGVPNDLHFLEAFARERGMRLFDDAAQALGASIGGRPVGGFGDIGLYSFDKGKNITSIDGGALVASDPSLTAELESRLLSSGGVSRRHALTSSGKLLAYSLLLRPGLYGIVNRLPLGLGTTPYDDRFPVAGYSQALAAVAELLLKDLDSLRSARTERALRMRSELASSSTLRSLQLLPGAVPAWARLPVFVTDGRLRERIISRLVAAGIGATASYPQPLHRVPEVARHLPQQDLVNPGADQVAATIMTLPTHAYVPLDLGRRVRKIVDAA